MPFQTIEPEIVELNAWPHGYLPDPEPAAVPVTGLIDANNVIPDRNLTGAVVTRPGLKRFGTFILEGYKVKSLYPFNVIYGAINVGRRFLMAVVSTDVSDVADNVQIWRINLVDGTPTRIDDVGRAWDRAGGLHFGATVDNVFYGGGDSDPVYSYRPYYSNGVETSAAIAWDPDATMPQRSLSAWASGTAYTVNNRVEDGGFVWACIKDHTGSDDKRPKNGINAGDFWNRLAARLDDWVDGKTYKIGDKVMKEVTDNPNFPRGLVGRAINKHSAFIAARNHTANVGNSPPGWAWEPFRAPVSNIGLYHGSRLFMRDKDVGTSRVRYSGRARADGLFRQDDWESSDIQGPGFMDIRTGDGDDVKAFAELGNMLVIWKRRSTHILSGLNPSTWSLRQIADVGCLSKKAWAFQDGIVYFMSDMGLMRTDGAVVEPVPGADGVEKHLRDSIEWEEGEIGGLKANHVSLEAFDGQLFVTIPKTSGAFTLVYDPALQSFWPQDFATKAYAVSSIDKIDRLFFGSTNDPALILQYNHPDAANQDDTREVMPAMQDIPWKMRTGWLSFGTSNEDRKLRRTWLRIRTSAKTVTLNAYKNLTDAVVWTVNKLIDGPYGTVEGKKIDVAQAISFKIEGTKAPATILGLAIHTQFRRKRYHRA